MRLHEVTIQPQMPLINEPLKVHEMRSSCKAGYYYCSEKARLQALGVQPLTPHPTAEIGTKFHNNVLAARPLTPLEQELETALKPFYTTGSDGQPVISRTYKNLKLNLEGTFLTHGSDGWKVEPNRDVWILEYKTKSTPYLTPVDIGPARFQNKEYCWLYDPIFKQINFNLRGGQIIYVKRVGNSGEFQEIGQTEKWLWNEYSEKDLLEEFEQILYFWNNPEKQIPPKHYKCLHCAAIYKEKCYFQTGKLWCPS